jgi:unsaturated rhamnogalacturonyl hydrolase
MSPSRNMSIAVADSLLTRFPDPDDIPFKSWCYVQGYVLNGFEKLWQYTGERKYFDYVKKFVDQHVNAADYCRQAGSIRNFTGNDLDDMMAGTAVLAVYEQTGETKYRLAAERIRAAFNDYPRNSDGGFYHSKALPHEMWIDGVFMGGMFLIRYGTALGDQEYCFNEVANQILILASHCRKGDTGLFLHAYDEARQVAWADPLTGLSSEVWSEGLGWYALVVVETLKVLPLDHPRRSQVRDILLELLEGLRKVQDSRTGLWYQVVDQGSRPDNWHDTSGSAMFVYAIQRALDLGYVSAEVYAPVVRKGYQGILTKAVVRPDGLVDIYDACDGVCVQTGYDAYINYPKSVNAKEAVGGFLWATAIVEKPKES